MQNAIHGYMIHKHLFFTIIDEQKMGVVDREIYLIILSEIVIELIIFNKSTVQRLRSIKGIIMSND